MTKHCGSTNQHLIAKWNDPAPSQGLEPPAYNRLAEIQVPTLIVMGAEDDPRLFKDAGKLERDIVGARRATIAETHHMPNMEKPEEFNALILDFLEKSYPRDMLPR